MGKGTWTRVSDKESEPLSSSEIALEESQALVAQLQSQLHTQMLENRRSIMDLSRKRLSDEAELHVRINKLERDKNEKDAKIQEYQAALQDQMVKGHLSRLTEVDRVRKEVEARAEKREEKLQAELDEIKKLRDAYIKEREELAESLGDRP